jgi:phosphatidylcholine synthase
MHRAGLFPAAVSLGGSALICAVSALQFAHREAKTAEDFRGFPSYWNVVAVYLFLLRPAPALAWIVVVLLALLALSPVRFVYPTRTREWRGLTLSVATVWLVLLASAVASHPRPARLAVWLSLLFPLYYLALSLKRTVERPRTENA